MKSISTKLEVDKEKSMINKPKEVFTSIYHLINKEQLKECFEELDKDKAVGLDKVTKDEYLYKLDSNLDNLFFFIFISFLKIPQENN